MAERKLANNQTAKRPRRRQPAAALREQASTPDSLLADNNLFQTDPLHSRPSMFKPKGWTNTIEGYVREAKKLTSCILHNERLRERAYQWHVTVNFEAEQTPPEIRARWSKVCGKLKKRGVVALWVLEVNRANHVHYHLIVASQISEAALESAVEEAMPPREVIGWHKRLQRIESGAAWQLAHYVTKAKIAGYVGGRQIDDYYASKRLLFKPKLGLVKFRHIGDFWAKPKAAIWKDIIAKEERIAAGLNQQGVRTLVAIVYGWLDRTVPLKFIERAFGYHADSAPVQRWIEQQLADGEGVDETGAAHAPS